MTNRDPVGVTVAGLKIQLTKLEAKVKVRNGDVDEWLRALYSNYANRMQSATDRTWTTGSILIPLAMAGFAAFIAVDCPKLEHAVVLGSASSATAWCWLFIAENYRAFRQKSEAWVVAIQQTMDVYDECGPKLATNVLTRVLAFEGAVQKMRWVLVCAITIGWILIIALWEW